MHHDDALEPSHDRSLHYECVGPDREHSQVGKVTRRTSPVGSTVCATRGAAATSPSWNLSSVPSPRLAYTGQDSRPWRSLCGAAKTISAWVSILSCSKSTQPDRTSAMTIVERGLRKGRSFIDSGCQASRLSRNCSRITFAILSAGVPFHFPADCVLRYQWVSQPKHSLAKAARLR